jgi:hypothetical protein
MFECSYPIKFWECIKNIKGLGRLRFHPDTWAQDLLIGKLCTDDVVALIATCCWSLWTGRNNRRHGKEGWSLMAAAKFVSNMVEDVLNLYRRDDKEKREGQKWQPPTTDWFKLNIDGAFCGNTFQGAIGAVIRDSIGAMITANAFWYNQLEDALMAEVLAVRNGFELARNMGITKVQVES